MLDSLTATFRRLKFKLYRKNESVDLNGNKWYDIITSATGNKNCPIPKMLFDSFDWILWDILWVSDSIS